jgi:hypothetical protein
MATGHGEPEVPSTKQLFFSWPLGTVHPSVSLAEELFGMPVFGFIYCKTIPMQTSPSAKSPRCKITPAAKSPSGKSPPACSVAIR